MITFLPSTDFDTTARILDDKRLGAQRYEAWSILKWLRNPADYPHLVRAGYCRMWSGYEALLVRYTNAMLREWARRGKNNKELRPEDAGRGLEEDGDLSEADMPPWLGCERLHSYHRHALVAKLPEHYGKLGWTETGHEYNGSYPWPICLDEGDAVVGGADVGSWILRWPKSVRLDPVPILVSGNGEVSRGGKAASSEVRLSSQIGSTRDENSISKQKTVAANRRTTKHKANRTKDKNARKHGGDQPVRRSLRISKRRKM